MTCTPQRPEGQALGDASQGGRLRRHPETPVDPGPRTGAREEEKAIRFPGRRVLEAAACAALCGGILYGAARVGSLPSVTLLSGGSASSTAAAYEAAPELATYSMADAGGSDRAVNTSGSTLLTSGNVENDTAARTADNAKIIYTTYLSIETKDYDWAYQQLNDTLSSVDGYLESSSEYTDSTDSTRTLSLTLRVPESSYDAFVDAAEQAGSVTSKSESAEDVTTQYMDIEAPARQPHRPAHPSAGAASQRGQPHRPVADRILPERCPVPDRELPEPAQLVQPAGLLLHREHHP